MGPCFRKDDVRGFKFQTAADTASRSRRVCARILLGASCPSEHQRAQGMPGARRARSLACEIKKAHERSHHGYTGNRPAFPAQWFLTVSFVLSPVIGLSCHCRWRSCRRRANHEMTHQPKRSELAVKSETWGALAARRNPRIPEKERPRTPPSRTRAAAADMSRTGGHVRFVPCPTTDIETVVRHDERNCQLRGCPAR
jgi:hypothetical protein